MSAGQQTGRVGLDLLMAQVPDGWLVWTSDLEVRRFVLPGVEVDFSIYRPGERLVVITGLI